MLPGFDENKAAEFWLESWSGWVVDSLLITHVIQCVAAFPASQIPLLPVPVHVTDPGAVCRHPGTHPTSLQTVGGLKKGLQETGHVSEWAGKAGPSRKAPPSAAEAGCCQEGRPESTHSEGSLRKSASSCPLPHLCPCPCDAVDSSLGLLLPSVEESALPLQASPKEQGPLLNQLTGPQCRGQFTVLSTSLAGSLPPDEPLSTLPSTPSPPRSPVGTEPPQCFAKDSPFNTPTNI